MCTLHFKGYDLKIKDKKPFNMLENTFFFYIKNFPYLAT